MSAVKHEWKTVSSSAYLEEKHNIPGKVFYARVHGDLAGVLDYQDPGDSSLSSNAAVTLATTRALKTLARVQRHMTGAVFLAEAKEAFRMLRRPGESLVKSIKRDYLDKLKRLKREGSRVRREKALAGMWLEASFGWSPLVSDLNDAVKAYKAFTKRTERQFEPVFGRAEDAAVFMHYPIMESFAPVSHLECVRNGTFVNRVSVRVDGAAIARAQTTSMGEFNQAFGLSADQFMPTLWEALPWSFLMDYFSNIGDIIEIGCSTTASLAWSKTVVINARERNYYVYTDAAEQRKVSGANLLGSGGGPWSSFHKKKTVSRTSGIAFSIPSLTVELPGRPAQWANMTALFAQTVLDVGPQNVRPYRLINGRPHFR